MNYQRPTRTPAEEAALRRTDRREFWILAAAFTIFMLVATGVYTVVNDAIQPPNPATGAAQQMDEPALPIPDGGAKPTSSGDRGGTDQVALMWLLIVALGGGSLWVVHSSRKARRRRVDPTAVGEHDIDDLDEAMLSASDANFSGSEGSPKPR